MDHIEGTSIEPVDPIPEAVRRKEPLILTEEQKKSDMEWKKDHKEWKQAEAIAKQQIASSIPDSLFMKVQARGTAYEIWTEIESILKRGPGWSQ